MNFAPLIKKDFPEAPPLKKLIGPSFIILAAGLGSGELILWPYLSVNFGLGLIWAAVIGITFQFFINMEIERYSLATGESVFVGLARKFGRLIGVWFILSTFIPWMWPGIAASSAKLFAAAAGIPYSGYLGVIFLIILGIVFSFGRVVYKTQERVQKAIIMIGIPFIFILTFFLADSSDWQALFSGLMGKGEGYWFIPAGLPLATFLAAFAYSGAGGNLNLAQSFYVKEKGYGLGKYFGRITNIFASKGEEVNLEGAYFEETPENISRFKSWWKKINIEHGIIFWLIGTLTMLTLSVLAYTTVYQSAGAQTGINFLLTEASAIGAATFPFIGTFFLLMAALMLFGTQLSIFGATSRIISENLVILSPKRFPVQKISKYFYFALWAQILAGAAIFLSGFSEPLTLVIIGAVLNAFSMFVYSGLVLITNKTSLPRTARPSLLRTLVVGVAFVFYGAFSIFVIAQNIPSLF